MKTLFLLLICLSYAEPTVADNRDVLGIGRLFTNDYLGDRADRWRSGSYQVSIMRGEHWAGSPPAGLGQLLEFRLRTEIISSGPDSGVVPDRPYVGSISLGIHNHMALGPTQLSFGADLVAIGPQTGVSDFQEKFHEQFSLPGPRGVSTQLDDAYHLSMLAELSHSLKLNDFVTIRPYAELQLGVEEMARVGGDIIAGPIGHTDMLVRDLGTGQLIRSIEAGQPGAAVLLGADWAYVVGSVYLPETMGYVAQEDRFRGRVGLHWQLAPRVSFFYGLTYLSKEFVGQSEGQLLGGLKLNFTF
jgi:hypothetical protein